MNVLFTLLRKHLGESRWLIGLSCAALFGISILTVWLASFVEQSFPTGGVPTNPERFRFLSALGGQQMDNSTAAIEVCWWNHPFIVLIILGWVFARGSGVVSGEIERGTIDLTLSRPISRSIYLTSQILFSILGLILLATALILGNLVATPFFKLISPPGLLTLLKPAANLVAMGMAVFGYTMPFSTIDVVRWRAALIAVAITLLGIVGLTLSPIFPDYKWLERISIFQFYAPVAVVIKGEPLLYNSTILLLVFGVGAGLSYWSFSRRDLPSNS